MPRTIRLMVSGHSGAHAQAAEQFTIPPTDPEDMAVLHFTSGTTGMPKGRSCPQCRADHYVTGKYVLDFHPGDVFWCTADPGWVTGTSYGMIAPLVHGITNIVDEAISMRNAGAASWQNNR